MDRNSLTDFFRDVSNQNYTVLSIDLSRNGTTVSALQNILVPLDTPTTTSDEQIEASVRNQQFFQGKWTRFNILVVSFLKFCRDVDPWADYYTNCDIIFEYFSSLNNCLLNDSYQVDSLIDLYLETLDYVVRIAKSLDANYTIWGTRKYQFLSYTSSIVSRLFNSIKKPVNKNPKVSKYETSRIANGKQRILLTIINELNTIYFLIDSPQLCSNIFKNFKPKCSSDSFRTAFPIVEQIKYRYLLGRYYLMNERIANAFVQLNSSFASLLLISQLSASSNPANVNVTVGNSVDPRLRRNMARLLKYLIPAGLILGKLPNMGLVRQIDSDLSNRYTELIRYMKSGNIHGINHWLQTHETELRRQKLLLLLVEKLPMVAYTFLLKTLIENWSFPQGVNRLPYDLFERALRVSIDNNNNNTNNGSNPETDTVVTIYNGIQRVESAENILVTLINLGYLRANCFPLLKTLVFKRSNDIREILPPIDDRVLQMFPLNSDDDWLER